MPIRTGQVRQSENPRPPAPRLLDTASRHMEDAAPCL